MCPFLEGLGLPKSLLWAACPLVDSMQTTLRISCPAEGSLEIVDKTRVFGRNVTTVDTTGLEQEKKTRGGRKTFMLSAATTEGSATLNCRLVSRGVGWHTRQDRRLSAEGHLIETHTLVRPTADDVVVERLFRRRPEEDLKPPDKS